MEAAGLVLCTKQGRECTCTLDRTRIEVAQSYTAEISEPWDDAVQRLRLLVEDPGFDASGSDPRVP